MSTRKRITAAALAVMMCVSMIGVAPTATAQEGNGFDAEIVFQDDFSAQENQTIGIRVTNNGTDDMTNPVADIPIQGQINISETAANNVYVELEDNTTERRSAVIQESRFRDSDALVIEGVEVPAGETRTYYFNVTVESPGERTIEAEVFPLNNAQNTERVSASAEAVGIGTLEATVQGDDDAEIQIDGSQVGDGDVSVDRTVGTYDIGANVTLVDDLVVEDVGLATFETERVTYVSSTSADDPTVLARTSDSASILGVASPLRRGNAETNTTLDVEFTIDADGRTYVGLEEPGEIETPQGVTLETEPGDPGSVSAYDLADRGADDDLTVAAFENTTGTDATITYIGYPVGDATKNNEVTSTDASTVARELADGDEDGVSTYADVNDDGEITAVDAMLIEQYADENRDADYNEEGS